MTPENEALGLARLNAILDQWNADQEATYTVTYPTFTTTSGLSPHTIGLAANSPTWTVTTNRPVAIMAANRWQGSGTTLVRIPITIHLDQQWWVAQSTPNIQSGIPTDLYYSPTWPNGSVYLWPVPNDAFTVELQVRLVLAQLSLSDTFTMPPGYLRALMLTLAEDLTTPLTQPLAPSLVKKAADARALIFGVNTAPVRIRTNPIGSQTSWGFNWRSRTGGGAHY